MHIEKDLSLEGHYVKGVYPVLHHRHEKFPGAESLADVQERAERAIQNLVLPHVWDSVRVGWKADGPHIALVSHGLCISELVAALLRLDTTSSEDGHGGQWTGLLNTAWTRVSVDVVVSPSFHRKKNSDQTPPSRGSKKDNPSKLMMQTYQR